ncbi:hypothetical protein L917_17193 [Phytophthora nicotianae]|uniref:Uncharacterized protein n=3 Tax=Phytophthora nicotianae TaxID=4792 RepID=W2R2Z9_PHYN3|nr:hypothetical protein PPTG_21609 [Phytophthora nicotianae INRA-310]ETI35786.1 hypothetical protein F443_17944 [Phytophthora nicotianae P1569]ETL82687.1 hypothetical protein L917_17193 [Phytophthora nicotianae]ETN18855.1 hypothetical protein PPTG_21609 [Phytophthora nicotianae INRA-310]
MDNNFCKICSHQIGNVSALGALIPVPTVMPLSSDRQNDAALAAIH